MANGMGHRGKNETARTRSTRYQDDIEWRSARRSLLKSAIFALACGPVSKSRLTISYRYWRIEGAAAEISAGAWFGA
jgi:hypothetical protein